MRKLMKGTLILIFIGLSVLIGIYTYAAFHPLALDKQRESITLYDVDGNIFYESNFKKNMEWTPLDEIPQHVQDAFVSVEDKRFYYHAGFDPIRMVKALANNLTKGGILQGGSTITQQYAKNLFLTNEQTITRKIEEFFYAARLEMQYSKEEILEGYLNTLYFGHGVYGVKSAANYFFEKTMDQLTNAELAMLIGIPNGPSIYSPFLSMENAKNRQELILSVLVNNKVISEDEKAIAINQEIKLSSREKSTSTGIEEYYIASVIQELKNMSNINTEHELHIYTYYDPNVQSKLQDAIQANMSVNNELEVAAVVIQPFTGNIMAIVGGKDYTISQYNRALYSQRQVASTIKPLLYYTALQQGFTPSSTFISQATTFKIDEYTDYAPANYLHKYPNKEISMINAISVSDNIYAVKTHLFLGENTLHNALLDFGITQSKPNPSEALGTVNMSIVELAKIYNTFASEGLYTEPAFISKIVDANKIVYERKVEPKRLLKRDETLVLNQMLTSSYDLKNITSSYPTMMGNVPEFTTGVKSGTSDWDALVVGFNPEYTIGIWNGFDDNRFLDQEYFEVGKRIYKQLFSNLYKNKESIWYQPSNNIEVKYVDPISGKESSDGNAYWYIK